jgi:large subunit ribosomal protein L22
MEARALKRYIGSSPRKMRLVVDLIRNKRVDEAVGILRFTNKNAAKVVEQTLISAYNNLLTKLDSGRLNQGDVLIKEIFVNGGPSMKRILPAPQGRANRIQKRSAHLTVVVEQLEEKIQV